MKRVNKRPVDHFEGKWRKDRKYTLYAIVVNNGTTFRSLTAKDKDEPYVIYDSENETFSANPGWEIVEMSEDSRLSAMGGNGDAIKKTEQTLTDAEKAQALENIGAVASPGSEHVTVKIRGCVWDEDDSVNKAASVTGGKVIIKSWNPATSENRPDREITIPAPVSGHKESVVEFDIQHGLHYQVHSEKSGLGASFRLVFTSSLEEREVFLWNLSIGVFNFGFNALMNSDTDEFDRVIPIICPDGSTDLSELQDWDVDDDAYSDDGGYSSGILVSAANYSFLLGSVNKSDSTLAWSKMNYGRNVPCLEEYYETNGHDYSAAVDAAKEDYDGAINTDKIVNALAEAPAAYFCVSSTNYMSQRYLPSIGELNAIYLNKSSINSVNSDAEITADIDNNYYWSSCAYDRGSAFYESMDDGNVGSGNKYGGSIYYVLAVSAFLYYY